MPHRRVDVLDYGEALVALQQHIATLTTAINNMHVKHAPPTHADVPSDKEDAPADNPFAPLQLAHPHHAAPLAIPHLDRATNDTRWEQAFKLEIPEFHSSLQEDELLDWIGVVEQVLEFKEVPGNIRIPLIAMRFRGCAATWWQQLKTSCVRARKPKIVSWDKLKKHM